nr:hypothetical protein CFP56_59113 [Quercus suber]
MRWVFVLEKGMLSRKYQAKVEINGTIPKLSLCRRGPWMGLSCYRMVWSLCFYSGNTVASILVIVFHKEEESCSLDCPPLSRWDPNEQRKLGVAQEVEEGELLESEEINSKWVVSLMKRIYKIVGFPIVKHEAQCLALFHLLEQDCVDVVNSGSSKGLVNSCRKGSKNLDF